MRRTVIARIWGAGGVRLLFGDALVLGALAAGIVGFAAPLGSLGRPTRAEVDTSGSGAVTFSLARDAVHEVAGPLGVTRLEVKAGRMRVLSSPCPRQSCRHGGWIGSAGEMLVCLPNKVLVRLPGWSPGTPEALSR